MGQPKTELRMTAVPETPPGAISDGARKTVSYTTINSVPAVISRKDCALPFQFVREDLFNASASLIFPLTTTPAPSATLRAGADFPLAVRGWRGYASGRTQTACAGNETV